MAPSNIGRREIMAQDTRSKPQRYKSRECRRSKASEGDAVVYYREPLATQDKGYARLSLRVKNIANSVLF